MSTNGDSLFDNEYQLICTINSTSQTPNITWNRFLPSNSISGIINTTFSSNSAISTLTFQSLQFTDSGSYVCTATTSSSTANNTAIVTVQCELYTIKNIMSQ